MYYLNKETFIYQLIKLLGIFIKRHQFSPKAACVKTLVVWGGGWRGRVEAGKVTNSALKSLHVLLLQSKKYLHYWLPNITLQYYSATFNWYVWIKFRIMKMNGFMGCAGSRSSRRHLLYEFTNKLPLLHSAGENNENCTCCLCTFMV